MVNDTSDPRMLKVLLDDLKIILLLLTDTFNNEVSDHCSSESFLTFLSLKDDVSLSFCVWKSLKF